VSQTSRWLDVSQLIVVAVMRTALGLVEFSTGLVTVTTVLATAAKELGSMLEPSANNIADKYNLLNIILLGVLAVF